MISAADTFWRVFGSDPTGVWAAPGRVNLIGEHTDYNEGFVLPAAIDLEIRLEVRHIDEPVARVRRADGIVAVLDLATVGEPTGAWSDYIAGTAWALGAAGQPLHGFEGVLEGNLPIGAGLSSSAALELASAWALSGPQGPALAPLDLAKLAQRAENDFVGVRCGLMDQFASACGVAGNAMLFDCRTTESRAVPLPEDLALVISHSGVSHAHGDNEYNARRSDCETAVSAMAATEPGITALRDVDPAMLHRNRDRLDERVYRRARHVVTENSRVIDFVAALEAGDEPALGDLMAGSQASMRDDYEIVPPEIDALVDIARSVPGVVGSRMTGGGFGGCTVSLVHTDRVASLNDTIESEYPSLTGKTPQVWTPAAVDGAGFVQR
jgi:galactokinase